MKVNKKILDLSNPDHAYFFGFIQMDGSLYSNTRNRGKLTIEISKKDIHILKSFQKIIPLYSSIYIRTRETNFKLHTSATLTVFDWDFRKELNSIGLPYGRKSNIISVPTSTYSEVDYWRGVIDADGSVGISSNGVPFITLTTKSHTLKNSFCSFLKRSINFSPSIKRNRRDQIYNFTIANDNAMLLVQLLYYEGCLALKRKKKSATEIIKLIDNY